MTMRENETTNLVRCGRLITSQEINDAKETIKRCGGLSRRELSETICEHWNWLTASGSRKITACLNVLEELEERGELKLPAKQQKRRSSQQVRGAVHTERTLVPDETIAVSLKELHAVELEIVGGKNRTQLWNEYVDRYHYLGYSKPFGCTIRYFIASEKGVLGCALVAGATKKIKLRDEWIGWTNQRRQQNLPWVINNTRFLIFPWVEVAYLASHILGQLARQVQENWQERWGYTPLLMETFVDPIKFSGTCYKAAGWIELGHTSGRGLRRKNHTYTSTPKMIYVKPLSKDFRERLCNSTLQGRISS